MFLVWVRLFSLIWPLVVYVMTHFVIPATAFLMGSTITQQVTEETLVWTIAVPVMILIGRLCVKEMKRRGQILSQIIFVGIPLFANVVTVVDAYSKKENPILVFTAKTEVTPARVIFFLLHVAYFADWIVYRCKEAGLWVQ